MLVNFFISKCGPLYAAKTVEWLASHDLSGFETAEYAGKAAIARKHAIALMIDDKITVLKHFPQNEFIKVWFCTEQKNIAGARKHDPEFVCSVQLVQSWCEIVDLIMNEGQCLQIAL